MDKRIGVVKSIKSPAMWSLETDTVVNFMQRYNDPADRVSLFHRAGAAGYRDKNEEGKRIGLAHVESGCARSDHAFIRTNRVSHGSPAARYSTDY